MMRPAGEYKGKDFEPSTPAKVTLDVEFTLARDGQGQLLWPAQVQAVGRLRRGPHLHQVEEALWDEETSTLVVRCSGKLKEPR